MSRHTVSLPRGKTRTPPARSWCAAAVTLFLLASPVGALALGIGDAGRLAPKSDMQVTVVASPGFTSGSNATYTLTLDNNGPQTAAGPITVADTLAVGLTYVSATSVGWSCSAAGSVVTCTWAGNYFKSTPTTVTITVFVTPAAGTSVTNVARVSYPGNDDTNLANNVATTVSPVTLRTVATTPDGATTSRLPSNGTNYSQTFVVTNTGNVSDSYTLVASVAPAGIVTVASVAGVAGTTATSAAIASGATANVVVVYSVATGAATGASATLTLTATSIVTATSTDPGTLVVTVSRAGIVMTKALFRDDRTTLVTGGAAVTAGEYVQYRVTVSSTGGAPAATVSVVDAIPPEVVFDSTTPDAAGWGFSLAGSTLTANLAGALAAGASRYFWIRVRVK